MWKNGWTLPKLCGQRSRVSVDFGTVTAAVGCYRDHGPLGPFTDGPPFPRSVDRYLVPTHWMPSLAGVVC